MIRFQFLKKIIGVSTLGWININVKIWSKNYFENKINIEIKFLLTELFLTSMQS